MVKAKKGKRQMARAAPKRRAPVRQLVESYESKLLKMVVDPCGAELVPGLGLPTSGICQRFTKYITPTVIAGNDNFAIVASPNNQSPSSGVDVKTSTGLGVAVNSGTGNPGEAFLEANAEAVAVLGYCIEVMYTGKLVDRKGYIGVCQAPWAVLNDIQAATTPLPDLLSYCQSVSPVPSNSVELKYAPTMQSFAQNAFTLETGQNSNLNGLMVVVIGVDPTQFVVKITAAVEYIPKQINGIPAPRPTKSLAVGTGERVVTALDRMGHWWHNLGSVAGAAYRMGGNMVYGATQAARFVRATQQTLGAATTLLALTG